MLKLSCFDWMFNDQMLVENQLGGRSLIDPSALLVWGLWRIFHMTERPWDWRCWRVWGGVTVKVRGSGQPLQSSSEEATSQLLCAHLRTVPFSDSPSPPTSRKAKL